MTIEPTDCAKRKAIRYDFHGSNGSEITVPRRVMDGESAPFAEIGRLTNPFGAEELAWKIRKILDGSA
jgi:hypothetical protein